MGKNSSIYCNEHGEIVGKGVDGKNKYEYVIFNQQQVEAIKLLIQKYSGPNFFQN